jgi:bacterioferritin
MKPEPVLTDSKTFIAERAAIGSYREGIAYLANNDTTTRRMLEEILAAEEEHAEDMAGLLKELGS